MTIGGTSFSYTSWTSTYFEARVLNVILLDNPPRGWMVHVALEFEVLSVCGEGSPRSTGMEGQKFQELADIPIRYDGMLQTKSHIRMRSFTESGWGSSSTSWHIEKVLKKGEHGCPEDYPSEKK